MKPNLFCHFVGKYIEHCIINRMQAISAIYDHMTQITKVFTGQKNNFILLVF